VRVVYRLERKVYCGSTGINVAAAVALAKQLGPGTIVTILCDSGTVTSRSFSIRNGSEGTLARLENAPYLSAILGLSYLGLNSHFLL